MNYKGFKISEPQLLTNGTYQVYVTKSNGDLVITGEGISSNEALVNAIDNLNYYLNNFFTVNR